MDLKPIRTYNKQWPSESYARATSVFECTSCKAEFELRSSVVCKRKTTLCSPCVWDTKKSKNRPYEHLYKRLLLTAKMRKMNIDISFEDFLKFTAKKHCFYCNNRILWREKPLPDKTGYAYNLDRKDNNIGYEKENLVVACWKCNNAKSNKFTHEEFQEAVKVLKWRIPPPARQGIQFGWTPGQSSNTGWSVFSFLD